MSVKDKIKKGLAIAACAIPFAGIAASIGIVANDQAKTKKYNAEQNSYRQVILDAFNETMGSEYLGIDYSTSCKNTDGTYLWNRHQKAIYSHDSSASKSYRDDETLRCTWYSYSSPEMNSEETISITSKPNSLVTNYSNSKVTLEESSFWSVYNDFEDNIGLRFLNRRGENGEMGKVVKLEGKYEIVDDDYVFTYLSTTTKISIKDGKLNYIHSTRNKETNEWNFTYLSQPEYDQAFGEIVEKYNSYASLEDLQK